MPRISGVDIPDNKPIRIALRYIYGVGPSHAERALKEADIDGQMRANKLTEEQLAQLAGILDANYLVEGVLRRAVAQNIARLRDIRCYRGDRHRRGLPVHGQRTKTNARTRKGRKKTVAGKKGVKGMK
jgi:small subunit ribosomal protein S13